MYKHILVSTDGSPLSLKAAKEAAALARHLKAKLTVVFVSARFLPPVVGEGMLMHHMDLMQGAYWKSTNDTCAKALAKVEAAAAAVKVKCATLHVMDSEPWEGILKAAKKAKCDLIVMASHGRSGLAGLVLGSVTVKVLTNSKTPVLVCR